MDLHIQPSFFSGLLEADVADDDIEAVKKAKDFYYACVNESKSARKTKMVNIPYEHSVVPDHTIHPHNLI